MKKNYDFSKMKEVTIKLDQQVVDYFKSMGQKLEVPYQMLINFYLRDCAETKKKLSLKWDKVA